MKNLLLTTAAALLIAASTPASAGGISSAFAAFMALPEHDFVCEGHFDRHARFAITIRPADKRVVWRESNGKTYWAQIISGAPAYPTADVDEFGHATGPARFRTFVTVSWAGGWMAQATPDATNPTGVYGVLSRNSSADNGIFDCLPSSEAVDDSSAIFVYPTTPDVKVIVSPTTSNQSAQDIYARAEQRARDASHHCPALRNGVFTTPAAAAAARARCGD
jgi:hypothetical protein